MRLPPRPLPTTSIVPGVADFAAGALVLQPFTLYLVILGAVVDPTPFQWERADPILKLGPLVDLWRWIPLSGVVVAGVWTLAGRPSGAALRCAVRHALLGIAAALGLVGTLRVLGGPTLPSFIPAEENADPGPLLSMSAGYLEEVLFRLVVLPLALLALSPRRRRARGAAVVLTGLAFAVLHQLGPGPSPAAYFVTRFLVPGCAMSAGALLVSPGFVVAGHCAAHLLLPHLFR